MAVKSTLIFLTSMILFISLSAAAVTPPAPAPAPIPPKPKCTINIAQMNTVCTNLFGEPTFGFFPVSIPPLTLQSNSVIPLFCKVAMIVDLNSICACGMEDMLIAQCMMGLMQYCGRKLPASFDCSAANP